MPNKVSSCRAQRWQNLPQGPEELRRRRPWPCKVSKSCHPWPTHSPSIVAATVFPRQTWLIRLTRPLSRNSATFMVEPRKTLPRPAKPRVIVTRRLPPDVEARMAQLFDASFNIADAPMDRTAMARAMADCDVLVPTITDQIDADLIGGAPDTLRMIASFGSGVDHIDLVAAREKGIIVTNTPGVLTEDTADMTMALILSVPRRLAEGEKLVRSGAWQGWSPSGMLGHRIGGKTLGIIGMGRIGQAVARRASGFNMRVLYCNRNRLPAEKEQQLNAVYTPLEELLRQSDFVTVHVPLTGQTQHMIGKEQFLMMKPTAYFIHTARGKVVDDKALVEALKEGEIAGAALDVYENEPALTEGMTQLENLMLLPHIGSASHETRDRMADLVADNVLDALEGKIPRCLVPSWKE